MPLDSRVWATVLLQAQPMAARLPVACAEDFRAEELVDSRSFVAAHRPSPSERCQT